MIQWVEAHQALLWVLGGIASIVTFVGTLVAVPMLVVRIPTDYFSHRRRHHVPWADRHPVVRVMLLLAKNILGLFLIVMGIAMLVLPGQGVVTMLIGSTLVNFPGKYRLERWVVSRRPVLQSINWLRRRAKREPLVLDEPQAASERLPMMEDNAA